MPTGSSGEKEAEPLPPKVLMARSYVPAGTLMVTVEPPLLFAIQTASRRLNVEGGLVTELFVAQAFTVSMSAVVLTLNVKVPGTARDIGAACAEVRTIRLRVASIVCGSARAATGVAENDTAALGLSVLPDVSRMLSSLRPASSTITSWVDD